MDFADYAAQGIASGVGTAALTGAAAYRAYKNNKNMKPTVYSNSTKIKYLARRVRNNSPELKQLNLTADVQALADGAVHVEELTAIAEGDGSDNREGLRALIKGINIRVHTTNRNADIYIIKSDGVNVPNYGDFHGVIGGHLKRTSDSVFHEIAHLHNYGSINERVKYNKRFKYSMSVRYTGAASTTATFNKLYLVIKNDTGASLNYSFSSKTYFTG